ncbi:MAG: hypothetical protein M1309_07460 [Actinobacteria bacterium]|nr:hypothetical protein [Actinomycetota bacterium]
MFFELQNLNRQTFSRLPERCQGCGWWQGRDFGWSQAEAEEWNRVAEDKFGRWGKLAVGDGRLLGMIQFGPAAMFARNLSCGPASKSSALLACSLVTGDGMDAVRKSLVLSMLAELREAEIEMVEAFCSQTPGDRQAGHLPEYEFLRDCGFYPVRSSGGFQLMRLELGGTVISRPGPRKSRRRILERIKAQKRIPVPAAF